MTEYPDLNAGFYRTSYGSEADLVISKDNKRIAIECKYSSTPQLNRGFWTVLDDLHIDEAWVITPINEHYPIKKNTYVSSLQYFLSHH